MNISILDFNTLTIGDIDFSPIDALGNVTYNDVLKPEEIVPKCIDADVVVVNKAKMTREVIEALPKLKYIGLFATGYNNIDLEAASEHGIVVVNVPGYSTDSVAQLVFAFILTMATNLPEYSASVHRGEWIYAPTFAYFPYAISELTGKTLGVIGYGSIGQRVARIGEAFGMNVIIHTRTEREGCPYRYVDRETIFRESDYLSLNCPLTDETAEIVNKDTLKLMKKSAFLINTARGGCIDSDALSEALNNGQIAGAGVDTLVVEPMKADDPLYTAKNCLITPHIAWASIEARTRLIQKVADNISAWASGSPVNVVNK